MFLSCGLSGGGDTVTILLCLHNNPCSPRLNAFHRGVPPRSHFCAAHGGSFQPEVRLQPADAEPVDLFHFDLHRNALFHRLDVADHANGFTGSIQAVQCVQRGIEGFGVQRAEAFVEEQRVDAGFVADQIGQRQRQRQADQEALAAGQGTGIAQRVGLPVSTTCSSSASLVLRCSR